MQAITWNLIEKRLCIADKDKLGILRKLIVGQRRQSFQIFSSNNVWLNTSRQPLIENDQITCNSDDRHRCDSRPPPFQIDPANQQRAERHCEDEKAALKMCEHEPKDPEHKKQGEQRARFQLLPCKNPTDDRERE